MMMEVLGYSFGIAVAALVVILFASVTTLIEGIFWKKSTGPHFHFELRLHMADGLVETIPYTTREEALENGERIMNQDDGDSTEVLQYEVRRVMTMRGV